MLDNLDLKCYSFKKYFEKQSTLIIKYIFVVRGIVMAQSMNLKETERRAWTLYFQDGFWDLFFGFLFLGGGLRTLTDSLWAYLLVAAGILLFIFGKRWITLPRLGEIKFGPERKARRQTLLILIMVAVAVTFVVLLLPVVGIATPGPKAGLLFVLLVPLILVIVAYFLDFKRLYVYAALAAIFMIVTEMVSLQMGAVAQIIAGGIALFAGLWYLVQFLRHYPLPDVTSMDEGDADGQA